MPAVTPPAPQAPTTAPTTAPVADRWQILHQKTPYPYTTPLPPPNDTVLDSIYAKTEPKQGTPVACRRCPDYLPEGGVWKLELKLGIYRIFHPQTGWGSLGSFAVQGNRLILFNDPTCFDKVGTYTWDLHNGRLVLQIDVDACHVNRRARSFANMAWTSCQPPSTEAAVTDHWAKPAGCPNGP